MYAIIILEKNFIFLFFGAMLWKNDLKVQDFMFHSIKLINNNISLKSSEFKPD